MGASSVVRRGAAAPDAMSRATPLVASLLLAWGCTLVGGPAPEGNDPPAAAVPGGAEGAVEGEAGQEAGGDEGVEEEAGAERRPAVTEPPVARIPVPKRPDGSAGVRRFRETRALWVVRTTLRDPDSVRVMAARASEAGFNTLIVQVRGRGDAYYGSRWEPPPAGLKASSPAYDPLALAVREGHGLGLAVHAWLNAHIVAGVGPLPDHPDHLVRSRPDLLAVPKALARQLFHMDPHDPEYVKALHRYAQRHGGQVEGLYTSPAHPDVKEHIYSVWMDVVEKYDLDGVHFDYIRYASPDFDYSRPALESFRRWILPRLSPVRRDELRAAYRDDPLAYAEAFPGPWGEFRRIQITELVRRVHHGVRKRRPELLISAAVLADREAAYRDRFQDWGTWLEEGIVDVVAPMAYTDDNQLFRHLIRESVPDVAGGRVWAGIGVYKTTLRGTLEQIEIARALGVRGIVLFSYDWIVGAEMSGHSGAGLLRHIGREAFDER